VFGPPGRNQRRYETDCVNTDVEILVFVCRVEFEPNRVGMGICKGHSEIELKLRPGQNASAFYGVLLLRHFAMEVIAQF
jgi:hypothetical protein